MTMLMPFIEQDPMFAHGFECGQIWERLESNYKFDNYLCHTENINQIEMMLKRFHYKFRFDRLNETWSSLFAELDYTKSN